MRQHHIIGSLTILLPLAFLLPAQSSAQPWGLDLGTSWARAHRRRRSRWCSPRFHRSDAVRTLAVIALARSVSDASTPTRRRGCVR